MLIDRYHPALQRLVDEVSGIGETDPKMLAKRALGLQRRFAETIATLAKPFGGQLGIAYCESESGEGKFRRTFYKMSVAWLRNHVIVLDTNASILTNRERLALRKDKIRSLKPEDEPVPRLSDFSPRYIIPVKWQQPLYHHRNSEASTTSVVLEGRRGYETQRFDPESLEEHYLDISHLESLLFCKPISEDRRAGRETIIKAVILLGDETVRQWLCNRDSLSTYEALMTSWRQAV